MEHETVSISLSVPPELLWGVVAFVLLMFITMSLIFNSHWKKYGVEGDRRPFAKSLYWTIAIILVVVMTLSVTAFEAL